jgi:hypothetical protein
MCLPTASALPLHSYGDFGSPAIGSSGRCYKSTVTIKSPSSVKHRSNFGSFAIFTAIRRASGGGASAEEGTRSNECYTKELEGLSSRRKQQPLLPHRRLRLSGVRLIKVFVAIVHHGPSISSTVEGGGKRRCAMLQQ